MLLEVKNLNIEFYDHDAPERVVNGLNMELDSGEILGESGTYYMNCPPHLYRGNSIVQRLRPVF